MLLLPNALEKPIKYTMRPIGKAVSIIGSTITNPFKYKSELGNTSELF